MENTRASQQDESIPNPEAPINQRIAYIILKNDEKVLLLRRKGKNNFSLPAGHIESHETPIEGAVRETSEEIGLIIDQGLTKQVHYLIIPEANGATVEFFFFESNTWEGSPTVREKDVHEEIQWAHVKDLSQKINPNLSEVLNQIYGFDR